MHIYQGFEHATENILQYFINQEANLLIYFLQSSFGQCTTVSWEALSSWPLQMISLSGLKSELQDNDLKFVCFSFNPQNKRE